MPDKQTASASKKPELSDRETQILRLAAAGLTDKEIARESELSLASVRTYWERLRGKLSANNRGHAIAIALGRNKPEAAGDEIAAFILRRIGDEAIFVVDESGKMRTWNEGVENLLGFSEEDWIGKHQSIFFIPEEKDEAPGELTDADKDGVSVNDRWHMRKDGSRFWGTNTVIALEPRRPEAAYAKIVRLKEPPRE